MNFHLRLLLILSIYSLGINKASALTPSSSIVCSYDSAVQGSSYLNIFPTNGACRTDVAYVDLNTSPSLSTNVSLMWERLANECDPISTVYELGERSFIAECPLPTMLSVQALSSTGALVMWDGDYYPAYTVRWRAIGSSNWTVQTRTSRPFSIKELKPSGTYEWQVKTVCDSGESSFSPSSTFVTTCEVPSGLNEISYYAATSAQFFWNGILGNTTYDLVWGRVNSPTSSTITGISARQYTNDPDYILSGLAAQTAYRWQLRTVCEDGTVTALTPPRQFTTLVCSIPRDLTGNVTGNATVNLQWIGAQNESYTVQYRLQGSTSWNEQPTPDPYTSLTGLASATTYEWRVAIACSSSQTLVSTTKSFTTTPCPTPSELSVETTEPTAVAVAWDQVNSLARFTVQYRPQSTTNWISIYVGAFSSLTINKLKEGTAYEWRVTNTCAAGTTTVSGVNSFTPQCAIPTRLYKQRITAGAALVTWANISGEQHSQVVRWRTAGTSNWLYGSPVSTGQYSITGLSNATTYEWQVQSQCGGQQSSFSTSATFTTDCETPYFSAKQITATKVQFSTLYVPPGTRYDLFWRDVRSPNSYSLTTPATTKEEYEFRYDLDGLSPDVVYEYQVRTRCDAITVSALSEPRQIQLFTPTDLSLNMMVDNRTPKVGSMVTYTIALTNQGLDSVSVQIENELPAGITFVDTPALYEVYGGLYRVAISARLGPNQTRWFTYRVQVNEGGTFINRAQIVWASTGDTDSEVDSGLADGEDDAAQIDLRTVDAEGPLVYSPNPNQRTLPTVLSNQPVPDLNTADLSLYLTTNSLTPTPNSQLTLTMRLANRGGATASGITTKLLLPTGWQMIEPGWIATEMAGEYVNQSPLTLQPGELQLVTISVQIAGRGSQRIQAQLATSTPADPDSNPNNGYTNGEDDVAIIYLRIK